MADEYRQLIVSADQIDSAVQWVEANKSNVIKKIETLDAEVLQLTEDVLLIKGLDLQHMKSDIEDLQTNTYTKTETDAKITEKVSALVAGAPERFDTLKELADWIDSHEDSAASMNSAIQKNAEDIATANENIAKKLNKKADCITGADYNSFVITGFYEAQGSAEKPTQNAPNGIDTNNNFYIIVQQRGTSYVSQLAISVRADTEVYVRTMSNSTWNAWRKLLDNTTEYAKSEDLATANTAIAKNETDIATANTNIQKNVDEITSVKNDVAINKSTLGTQCKNLLKPKYSAGYTQNILGVSLIINDDYSITASGTLTGTAAFNFSEIYLGAGEYRISSSKIANIQLYKSNSYVSSVKATPTGTIVTISESGTYSFRWYLGSTDAVVDSTVYPMLTYTNVTDVTYSPYIDNINTRISVLETLSDAVYKYHKSSYCTIDGYVLRVGNQVYLNLTATFHTACGEWCGGVINLPFNTKTPDNSTRYTIKQTQSDGRETSIYLQMGGTSFYSSTAFKKNDVITIPPIILDMYIEETTTTEGGE